MICEINLLSRQEYLLGKKKHFPDVFCFSSFLMYVSVILFTLDLFIKAISKL